jgi:hypothetical protein
MVLCLIIYFQLERPTLQVVVMVLSSTYLGRDWGTSSSGIDDVCGNGRITHLGFNIINSTSNNIACWRRLYLSPVRDRSHLGIQISFGLQWLFLPRTLFLLLCFSHSSFQSALPINIPDCPSFTLLPLFCCNRFHSLGTHLSRFPALLPHKALKPCSVSTPSPRSLSPSHSHLPIPDAPRTCLPLCPCICSPLVLHLTRHVA